MHSVCVSSQLLVSGLFIAVSTNTENFKIFPMLVCILFLFMQSYSYARTTEKKCCFYLHWQNNSMVMIWWLDYNISVI